FNFKGVDQGKRVGELSGGERGRLPVIAADARAGLFGPVRLARPSACLGEISGGRINGGASPPFVRVKAEDSSLKNIRL
ncbi:TPA: hypothetical protein F6V52_30165, partial [Klebsiella oxytoca]|nr:hypothetical protein [Klebsiella oxytoca]HAU4387797.1 hypothetical protein [Klebsiella oxytoca]